MLSLLALSTLLFPLISAVPCVQFDTNWNLYAFGGSQDVNLGQASTWGSPSPQTLPTEGRPPWTGNNTQCLFSQYNNAMYVLGADASDTSKIYIYSFGSNAWSSQGTSSPPSNYGNSRSASILDHDTNVIFTLTSGAGASLYQLDMSSVQASASSSPIAWESVTAPSFSTDGYVPTAAQASNHINYFGVPGTAAGSADIFIIHFAQFQPAAQAYPTVSGGEAFPNQAGQAISVPNSGDAPPYQMVYVPNDFSNTYVVTHWTDPGDFTKTDSAPMAQNLINSTQILPPPTSKDTLAAYAASPESLVQIDSNGDIYAMANAYTSSYTVSNNPTWTKLGYSLAGVAGTTGSSSSAASSASSASSASASASGSAASQSAASASSTGSSAASMTSRAASASSAAAQPSGAAGSQTGGARLDLVGLALGLITIGAAAIF